MQIKVEKIQLHLKTTWKISRNASDIKENIILSLGDAKSEVAPNIRYGETPDIVTSEIPKVLPKVPRSLRRLEDIMGGFSGHHATRFGLESLLVHYFADLEGKQPYEYLGLEKPTDVETSFSLPIMEEEKIKSYLEENSQYNCYKIKVDATTAVETVQKVQSLTSKNLRIDANEGFESAQQVMDFLSQVDQSKIEFLEQPLPASSIEESIKLFKVCPVTIIADESVEDDADFSELKQMFHGINVKLMKAGGYFNAIRLLKEARAHGMKTMIGCMIETSLGIWSAMQLNTLADYLDLDGYLLISNDPYHLINNKNGKLSIR